MPPQPHSFFVYGTLKRDQSNHPLIAASVRTATPATIRGRLYDVGPFPALSDGDERIHGEVLAVDPADLPDLLTLLDRLEGYDEADPAGSMYLRRIVAATTRDGPDMMAYAYFYNRDPATLRHLPGGVWHGPSTAEVAPVSAELTDFGRHVRDFPR